MKKRWRNTELDLDRSYTKRKGEWLPSIIKEHYCREATGLQSAFPEDFPAFFFFGGFLFIDVPPTSPHNFSPFHLPPKKKVVKRKDCWGSEPLGQLDVPAF